MQRRGYPGGEHRDHDGQRTGVEQVGSRQQVVRHPQREHRDGQPPPFRTREPQRAGHQRGEQSHHERERQVEEQQALGGVGQEAPRRAGVERAVVGQRERQRLVVREVEQRVADQQLEGVAGSRGDHERREHQRSGADGRGGVARRRAPALSLHCVREQHAERQICGELEPPESGGARQHAREHRALEAEQRAEAEGERDRERMRPGRIRQREGRRRPRGERRPARRAATAREPPREHGGRSGRDRAHKLPAQQGGAEGRPQRTQQHRLAGRVEPPEVAVGPLAVGDPRRGLEHQALVVRLDPGERRRTGHERRDGEQHEREPPLARHGRSS